MPSENHRPDDNPMPDQSAVSQTERDQLWDSLRALRPEIDELASGQTDTPRQQQLATLLARIVATELDCRQSDGYSLD